MRPIPDPTVLLLATGVVALVGWFFWFVLAGTFGTVRHISRQLDERSARQRIALAGSVTRATSLWLVAVRVIPIGTLVGLLAYQFAGKFHIR
ncbi:hypothetical protein EJC49_12545 [Aquibium carbonis]|uniref:Uncharacterized protein n=1 Tax=Aquibium carbonis TaxID=2495581 RepID=A0A429YX09_9HYPH|nr:hypothetical protein [Aquibium carbonis]RST85988.1 hypothetical protein EJC49_12545 [Aquibium carbonis]